jgi:predicted alpha-1,6-mannanase (GH76 family)
MTSLVSHLASSLAATAQTAAKTVRESKAAESRRRNTKSRAEDAYDASLDAVLATERARKVSGNTDEQTQEDRREHPAYDSHARRATLSSPKLDLEA